MDGHADLTLKSIESRKRYSEFLSQNFTLTGVLNVVFWTHCMSTLTSWRINSETSLSNIIKNVYMPSTVDPSVLLNFVRNFCAISDK